MTIHPILFVGAGPGDPELITLKGARALESADLVVYAGSLVNPALLEMVPEGAKIHDSAPLTLEEVLALMIPAAQAGKRVVRLHTGDPSLYGAIQEQFDGLRAAGLAYKVIPGVTAVFAAAATLAQELTLPEVSQTLMLTRIAGRTPVPEGEELRRLAASGGTIALYLSVGMMEKVVGELLAGGKFTPETPVAVVSRASWPDERIVEGNLGNIASKIEEAGIGRQAIILVGEVLRSRKEEVPARSLLYDGGFTHGYRQGHED